MEWIYETTEDNSARFVLGQIFDPAEKTLLCFGVNPSTARPDHLDNTLNKVRKICRNNGYDNWIMLNLYPQRTTNPDELHLQSDLALTHENMAHIKSALEKFGDCDIWLAYGNLILKRKYLQDCLSSILSEIGNRKIKITGLTKKDNPLHPLYQRDCATLYDYNFLLNSNKNAVRRPFFIKIV